MFSYEVFKISKNTFFTENLLRLLPIINLSSQKNKWVSNSKGFLIRLKSLSSFLFEKVITYTIIVLSRKIFKQISEVLCNRVHDICQSNTSKESFKHPFSYYYFFQFNKKVILAIVKSCFGCFCSNEQEIF